MGMLQNSLGLDDNTLANMSHTELALLRDKFQKQPEIYAALAPFEHQAFAREWTRDNPMLAVPSLTAAIPLQYLAKKIGVMPRMSDAPQSPASFDQFTHGFQGIGQGITQRVQDAGQAVQSRFRGLFSDYFR